MKRIFRIHFTYLMLILAVSGIIAITGCAPVKPYQPPVLTSKEDGIISSGKYRGVAAADIDNDGNPDIAGGASSPGKVGIWYGNGRGSMSEPQFLPIKGDVRSVALADFNGDGLKDIAFSIQKESSGIKVWLNQFRRKWIRGKSPTEGNNYEGILAYDVNRDGHMDIIAANATRDSQGGIQIWLGDGRGNWPVETGPTVKGIFMDVARADFDNDGNMDLAGAGWGTYGALKIWLGSGTGKWSSAPPPGLGSFYALSTADIDKDGNMDILAGTYKKGIRIFLGNGDGSFRQMSGPLENGSFWKVLAPDIDGDGTRDILAGSLDSKGIRTWRRAESGMWEPVNSLYPSTGTYYAIAIADVNKDGQNDVCAASFGEGIKLWLDKKGFPVLPEKVREISDPGERSGREAPDENDVFTTLSGFPEYKIGPGDVLEITMWKGSTGTKEEILVRPEGKISFGFVEDLHVANLTATQLDEVLTKDLRRYIKNPRLDVTVKVYKSKFVTFAGEIYTNITFRSGPGRYELTGKITLLEMLSKIGGPTQKANLRDVRIRNKNGQSFSVDIYKTINYGDSSQDVVLNDGDLVIIPAITKEANRVYVFGEVDKPGVYTFAGSEMHLFDAVSQAGGVTVFATSESTKIVRGDITRPEVLSADLKKLLEDGDRTQDIALANGDLVYVPRSFVGDINLFVKQITPLLNLLFAPARFRDEYFD